MCMACQTTKIGSMKKRTGKKRKRGKVSGRKTHRRSRVGAFSKTTLMDDTIDSVLGLGGAVKAQELGTLLPASVTGVSVAGLPPGALVDVGKVLIGALVPAFFGNKMISAVGKGVVIQGGLNLVNGFLKPAGFKRIGYPINSPGLAGTTRRGIASATNSPGYPVGGRGGLAGAGLAGVSGI